MKNRFCDAIWVAYASPSRQEEVMLFAAKCMAVREAINQSGLLKRFPEIDLGQQTVGIDGRKATLDDVVNLGQRVEVYRALAVDPNAARLRRAEIKRDS